MQTLHTHRKALHASILLHTASPSNIIPSQQCRRRCLRTHLYPHSRRLIAENEAHCALARTPPHRRCEGCIGDTVVAVAGAPLAADATRCPRRTVRPSTSTVSDRTRSARRGITASPRSMVGVLSPLSPNSSRLAQIGNKDDTCRRPRVP